MTAICSHLPSPMYICTKCQCSFTLSSYLSSKWCSSVDRQDQRVIVLCTPQNQNHYFHMQTQLRFWPAQGTLLPEVQSLHLLMLPFSSQRPGLISGVFDDYLYPTLCLYTSHPQKHPQGLHAGSSHYFVLFPLPAYHLLRGWLCFCRASGFPTLSLAPLLHQWVISQSSGSQQS